MTAEIVSVVVTGVGVLLGVWRIQAHYEARNDSAHAALGQKIDAVREQLAKVAADVAYLRGRNDERDRRMQVLGE